MKREWGGIKREKGERKLIEKGKDAKIEKRGDAKRERGDIKREKAGKKTIENGKDTKREKRGVVKRERWTSKDRSVKIPHLNFFWMYYVMLWPDHIFD